MTRMSFRSLSALGFLACAGGIAFALYLQHYRNFEPCPMCIFQRIAMIGAGLVFLLGALHGPAGGGRWVYALLAALAAGIGGGIAGRQVWLQSLPADQVPACGPTLDYLMKMMPWQKLITYVLKGEGSCAKIDAQWLGIALPEWTLFGFIGFVLFALAMPVLARRVSRYNSF
ncbi:MAG: disulfide bond formation protein B [Nevskia sp.]|nr:disulfide bond formation protein B [Nevskia sp.]